jgi:hypothetical protein
LAIPGNADAPPPALFAFGFALFGGGNHNRCISPVAFIVLILAEHNAKLLTMHTKFDTPNPDKPHVD